MTPLSVSDYHREPSPAGIARVERALLGALIVERRLRLLADLTPAHFASPARGAVFAAILDLRRPDLPLLWAELEARHIPPPEGGWGQALASLLESPLPFDDDVAEYVRTIKDAARERRLSAIQAKRAG